VLPTFREEDPFTQHIFRAIAAGLLVTFTAATVLHISGAPSLATALFVPIASAAFLGFLALFSLGSQCRYGSGLLWFLLTFIALPLLGYAIVLLFKVPITSQAAKFLPMIPQVFLAEPIYRYIERRYRSGAAAGRDDC
jgi:FtsH-binding integral membrane protein